MEFRKIVLARIALLRYRKILRFFSRHLSSSAQSGWGARLSRKSRRGSDRSSGDSRTLFKSYCPRREEQTKFHGQSQNDERDSPFD
ncbi:hypothetical protein DLM78_18625 [Leptospira stimsonii]|uniref:Uncharacterized protein n=1 Tax=Leptospira stimsonii TaxID=2202203 RepID=A0A8B3CLJ4_9LEPT|nr:hypothetical protein DLM78_18625 [Leptospira stimsonii]